PMALVPVLALGAAAAAHGAPAAAPAVHLPPYLAELDLTGDGQVTTADLTVVADALGATPGTDGWLADADVDGDGVLAVSDLAAVSQRMVYDDGPFELVEIGRAHV